MNILYIAFKDFSKLHYGASKKVISECKAFEEMGHNVTLIGRNHNQTVQVGTDGKLKIINDHMSFPIRELQPYFDKKNQIRDIAKYVSNKEYDFCYIRFDLCNKEFLWLLKKVKKICEKIFIEIPTYPYNKEYLGTVNKIRLKIDKYYARYLSKYVTKIVTFYKIPNDMFFGVSCINIPNGFDFDEVQPIQGKEIPEKIEIAAVSSMRIWHGYERMLEGMHEYYANEGKRNIVLHLVGDGRELPKYKEICKKYGLSEHVVFHGAMHGKELDELLEKCTLGIDSLGRHRTGVSVLSSLKSREYGAKGIPFINACKIDIIDDDFEYMLQVPPNDAPININAVLNFYDRVYKGKTRTEVAKEVRSYIEARCDMRVIMKKVMGCVVE